MIFPDEEFEEKCWKCGADAAWVYMPSNNGVNPFSCDKCVPRGCSCQKEPINDVPDESEIWNDPTKLKDILDDQGRKLPCIEFWPLHD